MKRDETGYDGEIAHSVRQKFTDEVKHEHDGEHARAYGGLHYIFF